MARAGTGRKIADQAVPDRISIPDLTGVIVAGALRQAELVGFRLVIADPPMDVASLRMSGRWVVASQEPPAGSGRFRGDTVMVTLRRDGGEGAGDREPRHPVPPRLAARPPVHEAVDDRPAFGRPAGRTDLDTAGGATVLRFVRSHTPPDR